jgi:hypothetical protein
VTLGDTPDGGIARHLGDQIQVETEKHRPQPHARRCHRRFTTRVTRTHNYNVVLFRKRHNPSILELWQEKLWERQKSH